MITHGILSSQKSYDKLLHDVNDSNKDGSLVKIKKIYWGLTKVFDNSNNARYNQHG